MSNKTMSIAVAIDRIAELAIESEDIKIIESSTTALKTLDILQTLGFEHISIDQYENM